MQNISANTSSGTEEAINENEITKSEVSRETITTNKGNEIDITPEKNHRTATRKAGTYGEENSSVDIVDEYGNIKTRRWYDENGHAYRDVDMTDHGNAKNGHMSILGIGVMESQKENRE